MGRITFNIQHWQALSAGLYSSESWHHWAQNQTWPQNSPPAKADLIPAMMRRRMSPLSKLALQVAVSIKQRLDAQQDSIDYLIFSSRHGELSRTSQLLQQILNGEDASPTAFSQSVHNTSAGLFTIATQSPIPATSLAAAERSLHHAFIEAGAYLAQYPNHRVLVIDFDESLPEPYTSFESQSHPGYALGLVLTGGKQVELTWQSTKEQYSNLTTHHSSPFFCTQSLEILANLTKKQQQWNIIDERFHWQWQYTPSF